MNTPRILRNEVDQIVYIPANGLKLEGELVIPANATGVVLFAHGSGSSRHSFSPAGYPCSIVCAARATAAYFWHRCRVSAKYWPCGCMTNWTSTRWSG